ncbi:MAG TPA: IPT/TIG domain-containing protein [Holophaga sp.]|nr:IPT/TIG domain-containing protein [Holophaga sp.]
MVVRNVLTLASAALVAVAVGCGKHTDPAASTAPVITSFTPAEGQVGATVTLTGTGFDGTTSVSVGGATATYSRQSDTKITLTVPDDAMSGIIGVKNGKGSGGTTTSFYVTPRIDTLTPTTGSAGTTITLAGSGFVGATKVSFPTAGGTRINGNFYVNSANQAQVIVPLGAVTGTLQMVASNGATATGPSFTCTGGAVSAPALASFSPAQALTGEVLTLTGTGFTGVSEVKIGTVSCYFTLVSDTSITVQIPTEAESGYVQVNSALGNSTSATRFVVTPTVASFTPGTARAGALVTLTGTGFKGATAVKFGNATASTFYVQDANTILANVAAGSATGPISVTSNGVTASSAASFTFIADATAAPAISGINPASGGVGTVVTVNGTGFTGATAVLVGEASATFTVVSDTQITVTVPQAGTTGFISVANALGVDGGSTSLFTVTPAITSLSPDSGAAGTRVVLTGSGFKGASQVLFGGVAANFSVTDANQIVTAVPADATTGKVSVIASGITAQSAGNFTVN